MSQGSMLSWWGGWKGCGGPECTFAKVAPKKKSKHTGSHVVTVSLVCACPTAAPPRYGPPGGPTDTTAKPRTRTSARNYARARKS